MDCTGSMGSWIQMSKENLNSIIKKLVDENANNLDIRVSFIGYRDIGDSPRFEIQPFTTDIQLAKNFISRVSAMGGADEPEDI